MESMWMWVIRGFSRGGPVMWPLLFCSLVSVTLTIERAIFWWRERARDEKALIDRLIERVEQADDEGAMAAARAGRSAIARVLYSGLVHREHGLTEAMQVQAAEEIDRMKQGLGVLDTIVTMAPLLGILGTVLGIIQSFDLLSASGIREPQEVVSGIAQALITTAAGLIITLVTLVPLNIFMAKVQDAGRCMENVATHVEIAFRRGRERPVRPTELPPCA